MGRTRRGLAYLPVLIVAALLLGPLMAYAAEDSSSGTASVGNEVPVISAVTLTDTGVVNKNGAQIDVWTEYWVKCNVADGNKLTDLNKVEFILWGPSSTEGGADSEAAHYTFKYTQATDTWEEVGPDPTTDSHLVVGNCQDPVDQQQTSGDFRLAFKLAKIAERTATATWSIKIKATDDQAASDSNSSLTFGLNFYNELTVDDDTHAWAGLSPEDTDVQITSPVDGDIDVTVTSNANFNLQAKGSGALTTNGYTIPLVNVKIHKDTLGSAVGLTTAYANIGGLTNLGAGASQVHGFKLWITVPAGQEPGDYTYTLWIQVVEYT